MKCNVRNWYCKKYPADEVGKRINSNVTFADVLLRMSQGESVYAVIGVAESLVRECIFSEIAKRMGCDYDVVYNIWLNS